jgi:lipid A 3-O-deacylase
MSGATDTGTMPALHRPLAATLLLCLPISGSAAEPGPDTASRDSGHLVHELRLGVMAHDVSGLLSAQHKEEGIDAGMEVVFSPRVAEFHSGVIRPNLGFTLNSRGDTSKVYAGLISHWKTEGRASFELGFGLALHNGKRDTTDPDRKDLGSKLLFRTAIALGWQLAEHHQISLYFDHISNAGLAHENEGMDLVGIRWGWTF